MGIDIVILKADINVKTEIRSTI